MRVIGGTYKGRRLEVPKGIRPTSELVRGAIINSLVAHGRIQGATVVDLFAGSGALGIEALSRGAAHVTFVDRHTQALEHNTAGMDAVTITKADVERWIHDPVEADVVLADPPYGWQGWGGLLDAYAPFPHTFVVAEAEQQIEHEGWQVAAVTRHGDTVVTQLMKRQSP